MGLPDQGRHGTRLAGRPVASPQPITDLVSKVGGTPVGITAEQWPACRECGRRMDFLLQLDLRRPLRLSERYAFAYLFMCQGYLDRHGGHQCETWYPETGANRLLLLESPAAGVSPPDLGVVKWREFALEFREYVTGEHD